MLRIFYMKVLLFSMPDVHPNFVPSVVKMPSLALASIAGNCPGHEVHVGDLVLKRDNVKEAIRSAIKKYNPDIVGLSAMTFQFPTLIKIAKFIKKEYDLPIAIGGYHATILYKEIAKEAYSKDFDFIFRGEADLAFNELLDELSSKKDFSKILGLSYKKGSRFIHNPARPPEDLSKIRLPKRDSRIWDGYHFYSIKLDAIETSRGCLNSCKYCSIRKMYGQTRREYEISRIIQDIKNAKECGAKYIFLTDDNVTSDARGIPRFEKLLDAIIDNRLNDIYYMTQASSVGMGYKESLAKKMKKAGFDFVFLGIENMSEKNLSFFRKGSIVDYSRRALNYLKDNGIIILGGLVIGSENDTSEDIRENYNEFIKLGVDLLLDQILTPYPGTDMREELIKKGLVTNKNDWSTYSGYFANVKTKYLSPEQLNFFKWKYYSKHFNNLMKNIAKTNLFKNHPLISLKYMLAIAVENLINSFKYANMDEKDRFKTEFERSSNLNKNLV